MIEQLPKAFLSRMEDMLQDEYTAFIKSYENPRHFGLRVNTLKISVEEFLKINPVSSDTCSMDRKRLLL